MNQTKLTREGNKITIRRTINAPKDKVWEAYSNPEIFAKWWGPDGWETTVKHMEFKPDGFLLYGMKCVDKDQGEWYGQESWGKMVFKSIEPKDSFSYVDYFSDNQGNVDENMPAAKSSMVFEETNGGTELINVTEYKSEAELDKVLEMGMEEGIKQTIDRLAGLLE